MTAAEFVREIRSDRTLRTLPVVMMSVSANRNLVDELYAAGINSIMQLPMDLDEFEKAIGTFCKNWRCFSYLPFHEVPDRSL